MTQKSHINKIANKLSRSIGILNRLKRQLPIRIKLTLYNSLIQPHLNYGILIWGHNCDRILQLQKKVIRIISLSNYNAHTEPLFKSLNILKVNDIFNLSQLKFYYNLSNNKLPFYFQQLHLIHINEIHGHYTRGSNTIQPPRIRHEFAKKCLRYSLPILISTTTESILSKVYTHSFSGFSSYVKHDFIKNYIELCNIQNCYICRSAD